MKICFPFILSPFLLLQACGGEKNKDTAPAATDTVQTADTTTLAPGNVAAVSPHPLSDWAVRHPQHDYFFSARVDALVNGKAKYEPTEDEMMDYTHDHLNKTEMAQLNTRELIYYCLKYPCSFSQICAADGFADSTGTPKIQAYLPWDYSGGSLSEWQAKALEKKRDSVIVTLNNYINQHPDQADTEYLNLLLGLQATESIPVMVKHASEKNDRFYTFLVLLMNGLKYEPFLQSAICAHLYGNDSWTYGNRVEATKPVTDSIKNLSMELYRQKK